MKVFGFQFFGRASNGDTVLASYHPRRSRTWIWSLSLSRERFGMRFAPRRQRHHQWFHFLPIGNRTLIIGRQDWHRRAPVSGAVGAAETPNTSIAAPENNDG